uniref:Myosin light chain kinase 2 n=1 Tax=Gopherus evgoodei TaxID=1825980 RepID=A0A8C4W6U9_9SAUR
MFSLAHCLVPCPALWESRTGSVESCPVLTRAGHAAESSSLEQKCCFLVISASLDEGNPLNSSEGSLAGKFGEVRTCTERGTGLKLAAKIIRKQGSKDKEMALVEIEVMNQLNHRNLIQLYDAIETPREIILFMEFVEGGELFERIIDEDYHLTEVDCMVFVRQICDGITFMHQMRVLHLDLKPENILCVSSTGHMVKIIDFGLARRYNPREKLKVNFGTPEFLSPEVVNYDQVSYSTDMWSLGVITYMLLSGLSPFLGDDDTETLNNVLEAKWYFDEEAFEGISDEAKDFVSNLIVKQKRFESSRGRPRAFGCGQHSCHHAHRPEASLWQQAPIHPLPPVGRRLLSLPMRARGLVQRLDAPV